MNSRQKNNTPLQYSQNFIRDRQLVEKLYSLAKFPDNELILDIGAGDGIFGEVAMGKKHPITFIEPDKTLFLKLKRRFANTKSTGENTSFESFMLPTKSFGVFANIPFSSTASILKKLLDSRNFTDGGIVIQKQAAEKFSGEQLNSPNTLVSVLYGISFSFKKVYSFSRNDFDPSPRVPVIFLSLSRRENPLLPHTDFWSFTDFVAYCFERARPTLLDTKLFPRPMILSDAFAKLLIKKPGFVKINEYVILFQELKNRFTQNLIKTKGTYNRIKRNEAKIEKSFRTRLIFKRNA